MKTYLYVFCTTINRPKYIIFWMHFGNGETSLKLYGIAAAIILLSKIKMFNYFLDVSRHKV